MLTREEEMLMIAKLNDADLNGNGLFLIYRMIDVWGSQSASSQKQQASFSSSRELLTRAIVCFVPFIGRCKIAYI